MRDALDKLAIIIQDFELPEPIEVTVSKENDTVHIRVYLATEDEGKQWGKALLPHPFKWTLIFPE